MPDAVRRGRCPRHPEKLNYSSLIAAKKGIDKIKHRYSRKRRDRKITPYLQPYLCSWCGEYHLTTDKSKIKAEKQKQLQEYRAMVRQGDVPIELVDWSRLREKDLAALNLPDDFIIPPELGSAENEL